MNIDVYCPFCDADFETISEWEGKCPLCKRQWSMDIWYNSDTDVDGYDIIWEGQRDGK